MVMNRRKFLKAGSLSFATATLGGLSSTLTSMQSLATNMSSNSDYKALVCVFLYGGLDNWDTVIPYDQSSYQRWAQIRSDIINRQSAPRTRESLLPLSPLDSCDFGTRQFALPAEMPNLHNLFQQGKASIVGNVGPLIEPVNKSALEQVALPPRLFSHNDQQATWMSGATEGAQYGWAGLFSDSINPANSTFANVTTGGGDLLLTGQHTTPYQVSGGSALTIDVLKNDAINEHFTPHFRAAYFQQGGLLQRDVANKIQGSFDANQHYNEATSASIGLNQGFPTSRLGMQLQSVANAISAREQLGSNRQVFMVSMGGFDTHAEQANSLPELQQQIDQGVAAFYLAMEELGLSEQITLFTASDFGRTLSANGDGTDHGWGGHHFVVGGGINGQQIFGDIPEAEFGHQYDAGNGRLIPTMAVDQYAAAMGQWFGVGEQDLASIFPNLSSLGSVPNIFS